MPRRPPTACGRGTCRNYRPCPDHPASWSEGQRGRAMPPRWAATVARILARDPWCWCGAPSTEVHHLEPGQEADAFLRGVCHDCHLAVTQRQAAMARAAARP